MKPCELEQYIKNDPPDCRCTGCIIRNIRNILNASQFDRYVIFQQISQNHEFVKLDAIKKYGWYNPESDCIYPILEKILDNIETYSKNDILQMIEIAELKLIHWGRLRNGEKEFRSYLRTRKY